MPLKNLAETHLSEIQGGDEDAFRFEQLSTFLTRICEHHLPFTLKTVVEWINADRNDEVNPSLPTHLHYGVPGAEALRLMRGVRSRRIAVAVGAQRLPTAFPPTACAHGLRTWDRWGGELTSTRYPRKLPICSTCP